MNKNLPEELRPVFRKMYQVFSNRNKRSIVKGGAMITAEECGRLLRVPVGQLTWEDFGRYPWKAMATWGDAAMYKHFLPRLLELLVLYWHSAADPQMLCNKICWANHGQWPDDQQSVLRETLDAMTVWFLESDVVFGDWETGCFESLIAWLASVHFLYGELAEAQSLIQNMALSRKARILASLIKEHVENETDNGLAFLYGEAKDSTEYLKWLYSDWVGACLEDAFFVERDSMWADLISQSQVCWRAWRVQHG